MQLFLKILMTIVATGIVCQKEVRGLYKEIKMNKEEE